MRFSATGALAWLALLGGCLCACGNAELDTVDPALFSSQPTYQVDIAPLLRRYCVSCHTSRGARVAGVELDRFDSAASNRVRNACVAIREHWVERFDQALLPQQRDPPAPTREPCGSWAIFSMPPGAAASLTDAEQVTLARWVELGAPP